MGVHNISVNQIIKELEDRQIPIPLQTPGPVLPTVAMAAETGGRRGMRRGRMGQTTGPISNADAQQLQDEHETYIRSLRVLLVERLQLEEELERLIMYSRDERFDPTVFPAHHDLGRVILDMLHCPMRMHEKVLFMLYFAAMKRLPSKEHWGPALDSMSDIIRRAGRLPATWSHSIDTTKSKAGVDLKHKLDVFHMDYDTSKKIFNYANTTALYEVIDIAVGVSNPTTALGAPLPINVANGNWRSFIIAYLNCIEYLTMHRDYKPGEIDELERRCQKMYTLLVTKIGGLEGVTNYFHCVGCGHVVWMCRRWGNLWRFRNEGVEAFNKIVSLRHNKFNGNGGRKRTRAGAPIELCPEFWSLGQWLGRWTMWQLGYADEMDPDRCQDDDFNPDETFSDYDTDESYTLSPGHGDSSECSYRYDSPEEPIADVSSDSDGYSSVASIEFVPCTHHDLTMRECRSEKLLQRNCVLSSS